MSESPKQDLEMLDKPSMPLSQYMAGWQVYKAKDIEDYCEELRRALFTPSRNYRNFD